jgi:hypothetical protein
MRSDCARPVASDRPCDDCRREDRHACECRRFGKYGGNESRGFAASHPDEWCRVLVRKSGGQDRAALKQISSKFHIRTTLLLKLNQLDLLRSHCPPGDGAAFQESGEDRNEALARSVRPAEPRCSAEAQIVQRERKPFPHAHGAEAKP